MKNNKFILSQNMNQIQFQEFILTEITNLRDEINILNSLKKQISNILSSKKGHTKKNFEDKIILFNNNNDKYISILPFNSGDIYIHIALCDKNNILPPIVIKILFNNFKDIYHKIINGQENQQININHYEKSEKTIP